MSNDEIIEIDENLRTEVELCRQKLSKMDGSVSTEDIPSDIVIDYRGILVYAKRRTLIISLSEEEEDQMENKAKKTETELYDGCNDAREEAILLMLKFGIEEKKILAMGYGRKEIDKMREVLLDTQWQHGFLAGRAEVILKLYDSGMTDKDIIELGYEYEDLYNAGQHQAKWEITNRLLGREMTPGDVVDCCVTDESEAKALSDKLVKFDKSL